MIHVTEIEQLSETMLHAMMTLREHDRVLFAYPLFVPITQVLAEDPDGCVELMKRQVGAGVSILNQMHMSTTRGL